MDPVPGLKVARTSSNSRLYRVVCYYLVDGWIMNKATLAGYRLVNPDQVPLTAFLSFIGQPIIIWEESRPRRKPGEPRTRLSWKPTTPFYVRPYQSEKGTVILPKKPTWGIALRYGVAAGRVTGPYVQVGKSSYLAMRKNHQLLNG